MKAVFKFTLVVILSIGTQHIFGQTQPIETDEQDKSAVSSDADDDSGRNNSKNEWTENIVFGGSMGAQFGNLTFVELSPLVGYKITEMFTAGVGFSYIYMKQNINSPTYIDFSANIYGPRFFLQHDIVFDFFAHAEFEHQWLNFKFEDPSYIPYVDEVNALRVGGGYNYRVGDNSRFQLIALYDLINEPSIISNSPWTFRIGFTGGF